MNTQPIKNTPPPVALTAYSKAVTALALLAAPLAAAGASTAPLADSYGSIAKPTVSPWSVEVAGGYRFAMKHLQHKNVTGSGRAFFNKKRSPQVDLITTDITGVYRLSDEQALTLRFAFGSGTDTASLCDDPAEIGGRIRGRVNMFSLMPGYRFTQPLHTDKLSFFAGVNVGIANESVKFCQYNIYNTKSEAVPRPHVHASAYGLGYSAEIGLRYEFTKHIGAFLAYEFSGNTAQPKRPSYTAGKNGISTYKQDRQLYHGIRAGISYTF